MDNVLSQSIKFKQQMFKVETKFIFKLTLLTF